jgi:hypothetical protein
MIEQAIWMFERVIERHKAALEELRKQGAPAGKIRYMEQAIKNYEEQLARLKRQAEEIAKEKKEEPRE